MLIAEEPRNGYQLIQTIEERSGGRWRPSPGSVYPTLSQFEDEGLIRATEGEGGKVFEITDKGREHLEQHAPKQPPWETDDDPDSEGVADLRKLVSQVAVATLQLTQAGDEGQRERARELLSQTRKALYGILAEDEQDGR